jgi:hypothetical protein
MTKSIVALVLGQLLLMNSFMAFGQNVDTCSKHLQVAFEEELSANPDELITDILLLTSFKIAKKSIGPDKTAYLDKVVRTKTDKNINKNSEVVSKIKSFYNSVMNKKQDKTVLNSKNSKRISDREVSSAILKLVKQSKNNKDINEFTQLDYMVPWLISKNSKKDTYLISDTLKQIKETKNLKKEMSKARARINGTLAKIQVEVYKKYKKDCLVDWKINKSGEYSIDKDSLNAQRQSVFAECKIPEISILQNTLFKSIEEVVKNLPKKIKLDSKITELTKMNSHELRKVQDQINESNTDLDRIKKYHSSSLDSDKFGHCDAYAVIDKKNHTTTVYDIDSNKEILNINSIVGKNSAIKKSDGTKIQFSSDGKYRRFSKGRANALTPTGSFLSYTSHEKDFRDDDPQKLVKLKDEFGTTADGSVPIIGLLDDPYGNRLQDKNNYKKMVPVLHRLVKGCGNIDGRDITYVSKPNRVGRQGALDFLPSSSNNLSGSCVNMEGYNFDLMKEFLGHKCPIYSLPENLQNQLYVRDGRIVYGTKNSLRRADIEHPIIVGGNGERDADNFNSFYFTPNKLIFSTDGKNKDETSIISKAKTNQNGILWRVDLLDEITNKKIQKNVKLNKDVSTDEFNDLVSLAASISPTSNEKDLYRTFKDLFISLAELKIKENQNIDMLPKMKKKQIILEKYEKLQKSKKYPGKFIGNVSQYDG